MQLISIARSFLPPSCRAAALLLALSGVCRADHGPGTSGSGFATKTAETSMKNQWSVGTHFDWTEFDSVDSSQISSLGLEHFDLLDRSYLATFGASFGVTDNFQIGLSFGYYAAEGSRRLPHHHGAAPGGGAAAAENTEPVWARTHAPRRGGGWSVRHPGHGTPEPAKPSKPAVASPTPAPTAEPEVEEADTALATFDPDGWTDLWLSAKYRVYRGPAGQVALFGGIKLPVGETRVLDSTGARVEPASTPGTGAWDEMVGLAYTFAATPDLAFDASAQYTFRGEKFDYRLGNRFDAGVAAGWRVFGKGQQFPRVSVMGEASVRHLEKSEEHGLASADTGGTALFLSPGFRVGFNAHAAWTVGVQFPVLQELNGRQLETRFRVSTSFSIYF